MINKAAMVLRHGWCFQQSFAATAMLNAIKLFGFKFYEPFYEYY